MTPAKLPASVRQRMQKCFNKAWRHFVIRKAEPSMDRCNEVCAYYSDEGNRCAIGIQVTVKEAKLLEQHCAGISVANLARKFNPAIKRIMGKFSGIPRVFLKDLQGAHDRYATADEPDWFSSSIHDALIEVATTWGLTYGYIKESQTLSATPT